MSHFQIEEKMFQPECTSTTVVKVVSCSMSSKKYNNRAEEALYRNYGHKKGVKIGQNK